MAEQRGEAGASGPSRSERDDTRKARQEIRTREDVASRGGFGRLWADYSLTIVLLTLTLVTLALHAWFGWMQYAADQQSHGQDPTLWGDSGYWIYFGEWTFQNWQSEFVQTLAIVVLSAAFVHRGSSQSKDSDEETSSALDRIERRLERIEQAAQGRGEASETARHGPERQRLVGRGPEGGER